MPETLSQIVTTELDDMKALNVTALDVKDYTSIADTMIIASGTSDRHTKSIASKLIQKVKEQGYELVGVEGQQTGDWILVDLGDIIVHLMLPTVRDFYHLEKLWSFPAEQDLSA